MDFFAGAFWDARTPRWLDMYRGWELFADTLPAPTVALIELLTREHANRISRPTKPLPLLLVDPFLEEIRLRVRRGWQDATREER